MTTNLVFVLIKPDGIPYEKEIIERLKKTGLVLTAYWSGSVREKVVKKHFNRKQHSRYNVNTVEMMVAYLKKGKVTAMLWEGEDCFKKALEVKGSHRDPLKNKAGTVRRDFAHDSLEAAVKEKRACENTMHSSDNFEETEREIKIWFKK